MCSKSLKHHVMICLYGIVLLAILVGTGNLFGSRVDWLSQHTVFPDIFRQAFYESGQLIPEFLFDIGGGQNIFHYVYYGFLSPGVLLSYLLPFVDMTTYITCLSVVSYLASGCLLYQFLKRHFQEEIALWAGIIFLTLPPMTYHFHHHIMFVWYMPFFLLGMMGLDRYFDKKKSGLFVVSVFCMILTNYLFSVGCLVFLFVYAVFRILQGSISSKSAKTDVRQKIFVRQVLETIILFCTPVLMSAFLLLPTAYVLFSNSRAGGSEIELYTLIFPSLEEYFYAPYSMGISAIMLVAVIGNLTCKTRTKADVFLNVCSLFILLSPVVLYVLNGTLYVRGKIIIAYSVMFLYNFCSFMERFARDEINKRITIILSVLFVILLVLLRRDNRLVGGCLLLEIGVLCCFRNRQRIWHLCPVVVSLMVSIGANTVNETYVTTDYYEEMYDEEIMELMELTEGNFYRTNIAYRENDTANKVYGDNFHGSAVYSSTYNSLYQKFYVSYMGNNEKYRNDFMTTGAVNELFYHFMGTRYIIGTRDPGFHYELIEEGEHLNLYENKKAYPLVYKSKQVMSEVQFDALQFPFTTEALMTHTIVETEEGMGNHAHESYIKPCNVPDSFTFIQETEETYKISLDKSYKNKILYLTFDIKNEGDYYNEEDIYISINGITNRLSEKWLYYNGNTAFDYVIPMENRRTLTIRISKGNYDIQNLKMYTSDPMNITYEEAENLAIDEATAAITCNVTAKEGEYLVTSIPYDAGFSAYINGEETEVELVNKAFVGVVLQEGENEVEILYHAPLYREGICLSVVGVLMWMVKIRWERRKV